MGAKKIKEQLEDLEFMSVKEFCRRTTYHYQHAMKLIAAKKIRSLKMGGKRVIPIKAYIEFCESQSEF